MEKWICINDFYVVGISFFVTNIPWIEFARIQHILCVRLFLSHEHHACFDVNELRLTVCNIELLATSLKLNCSVSMPTSIIISVNLTSHRCQLHFRFITKYTWISATPKKKESHFIICKNYAILFFFGCRVFQLPLDWHIKKVKQLWLCGIDHFGVQMCE